MFCKACCGLDGPPVSIIPGNKLGNPGVFNCGYPFPLLFVAGEGDALLLLLFWDVGGTMGVAGKGNIGDRGPIAALLLPLLMEGLPIIPIAAVLGGKLVVEGTGVDLDRALRFRLPRFGLTVPGSEDVDSPRPDACSRECCRKDCRVAAISLPSIRGMVGSCCCCCC